MFKKILLPVLAMGLTLLLVNFSRVESGKYEEGEEGPQWFSQWFEMKKDANGNIPHLMNHRWAQRDRALNKTNSAPILDSVQNIGPYNIGGRTRAIVVDWADTTHYFAGSVAGGLWETKNEGATWTAVNDNQENLNITAITQSPFDKNIYYYCTGEPYPIADLSSNTGGQLGGGVFKSTDGGITFTSLPSTLNDNFLTTWDIKHDLKDSNTVYVATEDKGLFRSKDGGSSFTNVFPLNTGITHIQVFPDGSIMIACRTLGIYKSSNGNPNTFTLLGNGFASTPFGLIEFAVCKNFPNVMFALVSNSGDNALKGTYKTSDGGATWRAVTNPNAGGFSFTWFCLTAAICPTDTNKIFVGSVGFGYSSNSGTSWTSGNSINSHSDYHILLTVPGTTKVLCGNDGGIWRYNWKNMGSFTNLNNGYTVTQYYCGSFFTSGLSAVMGAQDNGSHRLLNGNKNYTNIQGADGCFNGINQQDDSRGYISYQSASIFKATNLKGTPTLSPMTIPGDVKWFINPLEINPADGDQIYFPSKARVYRSTGGSFVSITNPENKQPYALGLSAESNPVLYYGGSAMLLKRVDSALTTTLGKEKDITATKPPALVNDFIGCIRVHPLDRNTIFLTLTNYNGQPRVWKVSNTNGTPVWTSISGNLPDSLPCNAIEVDPLKPNTNFIVGTDFGLYTTDDGGTTWLKETRIPNVCIYNIKLRAFDRKLFVFSHGRGTWAANVLPYPTVKPGADFTIPAQVCEGDTITVTDNSSNIATKFLWTFENGTPASSTLLSASTVFSSSGIKKVKLEVSNAFGTDFIEKTITVLPNPKPLVLVNVNDLTSSVIGTSYTWYTNGVEIVPSDVRTLNTTLAGKYKVKVINANGCSSTSNEVQVFNLGIDQNQPGTGFYFYPNPATRSITVYAPTNSNLKIYSLDGKLISSETLTGGMTSQLNISALANGIYIFVYETGTTSRSYKFTKL